MRKQGYSSIFIVDRKQTLLGVLTAEQARQAIDQNQSISDVMTTDIPTVSEDTLIRRSYGCDGNIKSSYIGYR